ncbi:cadherin-related family member 5 isoform X3 [Phascolarctos cinereus]
MGGLGYSPTLEASGWALGLLPLLLLLPGAEGQIQVCSVDQELFSVVENEVPTRPIANVTAPLGQTVDVSDSSNPADIFYIENGELRLTRAPDYETHTVLTAILECKEGSIVVTRLPVIVEVINVNDMAPEFPFSSKAWNVSEDTKVGTTVIPATELTATDKDGDTLFYSLLGQSPLDAELFFYLAGVNFPALQLNRTLDYEKNPVMVLHLLARTEPLTFEPGPVYAIDGDTAINEPIEYSIIGGNTDNTFQIGVDTGNVTMAKAVPVPMTFTLLVQAQQQRNTGSYSVTQVTIQAVAGQLYPPRFPQALYRGWLPPGTGINVAVRDTEDPDRELRLRAEDDDFPAGVPNSGLRYQITNSSAFRMSGEIVLTNASVGPPQVLYLQAEVLDYLTSEKDTTTIEILVQDTKPTTPGGSPEDQEQLGPMVNGMAIMGGVLGALLLLTLVLLAVFIYKHNKGQKHGLSSKYETDLKASGYDNKTFQAQESPSPEPGPEPQPDKDDSPVGPGNGPAPPMPGLEMAGPAVREAKEEEMGEAPEQRSPRTRKEGPVRSILTKERKAEEGGYKAVWFGGDISAEVDVVVINSPGPEESPTPEEPRAAPEESEEFEAEEPDLVLVVSEEPEQLLLASGEPHSLSVVPEEPEEGPKVDQSPVEGNESGDGWGRPPTLVRA